MALGKENFFWHKLHSLTGIIPVGYYLVQHLTLNTFSLAGAEKFNGIIGFFESMPLHFLIALKLIAIWIPLIFHAVYGVFIIARADPNLTNPAYAAYRENRFYTYQRVSGILAFLFLAYHMTTTSVASKLSSEGVRIIEYSAWAGKLAAGGTYWVLAAYVIGIAACAYHFSYGLWGFCIRWGITISEEAQAKVFNFSRACFVAVTLLGWVALSGFFWSPFAPKDSLQEASVKASSVQTAASVTVR